MESITICQIATSDYWEGLIDSEGKLITEGHRLELEDLVHYLREQEIVDINLQWAEAGPEVELFMAGGGLPDKMITRDRVAYPAQQITSQWDNQYK